MASTTSFTMTAEQLNTILDLHVEKMAAMGLIKKTMKGKTITKTAGSVAGSETGSTKKPNQWIIFSTRVRELVKASGHKWEVPTDWSQFSASLKEKNSDYASWTDEAILEDLKTWSRPTVSKGAAKKASTESVSASDSASESAGASTEKPKRVWSEEAKASAKAKRAATKAAKAAAGGALVEAVESAAPVASAPAPAPVPKVAKKIVVKKAAPPPPPAEDEAEMTSITFEGKEYFWNEETGEAFENIDGAFGDLAGTFDGMTLTPA